MSTTGFQATLEVDDAGTGAAVGGASTKFTGVLTLTLPSQEAGEYESTELAQTDGGTADPIKRYQPTGLIEQATLKGEIFYTKSNHQRLLALVGKKGYTWKLTPPDEDGAGVGTPLVGSGLGFLKKIDEIVFEKETPVTIKVEIRPEKAWTFA